MAVEYGLKIIETRELHFTSHYRSYIVNDNKMSKMCPTIMINKKNDKQKILIVDDESDITTALKMYIELQGFHVDTFTDPVNALAQFEGWFLSAINP